VSTVETGAADTASGVAVRRWRGVRGPLALAGAVLVLAAVGVLLLPDSTGRRLDPGAASPQGARALAQVLGDHGVDVVLVERSAAARQAAQEHPGRTTVVVVESRLLAPDLLATLPSYADDVVLVEPDAVVLDAVDAPVVSAGVEDAETSEPGCDATDPLAAGATTGGGLLFARPDGESAGRPVEICYGDPRDGGPWAQWQTAGTRFTAIGQAAVLTNDGVGDEGNATLALRALGTSDQLVWWYADPLEAAVVPGSPSTAELLPQWVGPVALQLALVAGLAVVWRARRLGRLVPEPLPVVVRAAETTHGRAALYRRAGARDRAAAVLRADLLRRLAPRFGLRAGASPTDVARGAARAAGRPPGEVQRLLLGPPPVTDIELARLADGLDELMRTIESTGPPTGRRLHRD